MKERKDVAVRKVKRCRKLFIYNDDQLWSTDSEDHDYECENEKKVKRKKIKKSNQKNIEDLNNVNVGKDEQSPEQENNTWGEIIPAEVLFMIFKYLIGSEPSVLILSKVARVCRLWYEVSLIPELWKKMDLSVVENKKEIKFKKLFKDGASMLSSLNLSGWSALKSESWQLVSENCPKLSSIDLTGTKITGQCLLSIARRCPLLESITLSNLRTDAVSSPILIQLIETLGTRLKSFCLSHCKVVGFAPFFEALLATCPNMMVFELSGVQGSCIIALKIGRMQRAWNQLKILRLTNGCIKCISENDCPGFPELGELSLCNLTNIGRGDNFITNLLCKSEKLILLDLRRIKNLPLPDPDLIPSNVLTHLYLSRTTAPSHIIGDMLKKWSTTLIELDLSDISHSKIEFSLSLNYLAVDFISSHLEIINLRGTAISPETVVHLVSNCCHLKHVDLVLCRELPRGTKKVYMKSELPELLKTLLQT